MPVEEPAAAVAPDPGAVLRSAREAAGLSVTEVADGLKLTVRVIEAIEANDRTSSPPAVYIRGFVRNYAKFLGIDAAPLLAVYAWEPRLAPQPREGKTLPAGRKPPSGGGFPRWVVTAGGLLMVAVLLGSLVWIWPYVRSSGPEVGGVAPSSTDASSDAGGRQTAAAEDAVPGLGRGEHAPAAAAVSEANALVRGEEPAAGRVEFAAGEGPPAAESGDLTPNGPEYSGNTAGDAAPESAAADAPGPDVGLDDNGPAEALVARDAPDSGVGLNEEGGAEVALPEVDPLRFSRLTAVGDEELFFQFSEDCWVEIFDTEGEILYQDLMRSRQSLHLVGAPPFQIRLGYAPGVTLAYNGEPVPLAPHTRNNVALLVVGQ